MLLVQVKETWNWHIHFVATPNQVCLCYGFFLFKAFVCFVVFKGFFGWVGAWLEYLFGVPNHSFLHIFNAPNCLQLTRDNLNWPSYDRDNLFFGSFLLPIVDLNPHMSAVTNLVQVKFPVGDKYICVSIPKVDEKQNGVERDCQNQANNRQNLLAIEHFWAEKEPQDCHCKPNWYNI